MRIDLYDDFWTDALVTFVAVLALPFYLGYLHAQIDSFVEYALFAGVALALGERLVYTYCARDSVAEFAFNASLRAAAILVFGGASFGLALWLV